MTQLSHPIDWCKLESLATRIGVTLVYRVARCQHGYTRNETCHDCEGGYADDHATYANIGHVATLNGSPLYAVSDDGYDVAYLADRHQERLAGLSVDGL